MQSKKHKRKVNHFIIFTTDHVDGEVKQMRIPAILAIVLVIFVCLIIGAGIGYFVYEGQIWDEAHKKEETLRVELTKAENKNAELTTEIEALNAKVELLSTTVNEKQQEVDMLQAEIANQSIPNEFPLTGPASIEEITEGEPLVIFTAQEGSMVIAAGAGVVTAVEEDGVYGNRIVIDHGNGYVSIYRNQGSAQVKAGDTVVKGMTLYLISEDNKQLGYQIMSDGVYVKPTDLISING